MIHIREKFEFYRQHVFIYDECNFSYGVLRYKFTKFINSCINFYHSEDIKKGILTYDEAFEMVGRHLKAREIYPKYLEHIKTKLEENKSLKQFIKDSISFRISESYIDDVSRLVENLIMEGVEPIVFSVAEYMFIPSLKLKILLELGIETHDEKDFRIFYASDTVTNRKELRLFLQNHKTTSDSEPVFLSPTSSTYTPGKLVSEDAVDLPPLNRYLFQRDRSKVIIAKK